MSNALPITEDDRDSFLRALLGGHEFCKSYTLPDGSRHTFTSLSSAAERNLDKIVARLHDTRAQDLITLYCYEHAGQPRRAGGVNAYLLLLKARHAYANLPHQQWVWLVQAQTAFVTLFDQLLDESEQPAFLNNKRRLMLAAHTRGAFDYRGFTGNGRDLYREQLVLAAFTAEHRVRQLTATALLRLGNDGSPTAECRVDMVSQELSLLLGLAPTDAQPEVVQHGEDLDAADMSLINSLAPDQRAALFINIHGDAQGQTEAAGTPAAAATP